MKTADIFEIWVKNKVSDIRENTKKKEWGIKQFSTVNLMFLPSRQNQRTTVAA